MKKFLALAVLTLATVFGQVASAASTPSVTVQSQGDYRMVSVHADPASFFQVYTYAPAGYQVSAVGVVQQFGVGSAWVTAPTTLPPPGQPSLYVTIRCPDGTVFTVTPVEDDGWWLE